MEFQLTGRSDRHFQAPSAGLENRQNSRVSENLPEWEVRKFRSSLFKGLWVSRGQSPRSIIAMIETLIRSALCGGEFVKQSGGLFHKEGTLCKRERPLKALPIRQLFLFGQYFGSPNGDN